jgi:hypothetical protein
VATTASSFPWVAASLIADHSHDDFVIAITRGRRFSDEDIELTSAWPIHHIYSRCLFIANSLDNGIHSFASYSFQLTYLPKL